MTNTEFPELTPRNTICPVKEWSFRSRLHNEGIAGIPEPEFFHCTKDCEGPAELTAKLLGLITVKTSICPSLSVEHFLSTTIV